MGRNTRKPATESALPNLTQITHSSKNQSFPRTSSKVSNRKKFKVARPSTSKTTDRKDQLPEKNPLLTHVVFSELLKCDFSFHTLQQIRLVCKMWLKHSLKNWRDLATVRLGSTEQHHCGKQVPQNFGKTWDIEIFFALLTDQTDFLELAKHPYRKYMFIGLSFGSSHIISTNNAFDNQENQGGNIWSIVGPEIQQLSFENCYLPEAEAYHFEQIFTQILLNLETLSFLNCRVFPHRMIQQLVDSKPIDQEVYNASPKKNRKLKKLTIDGVLPVNLCALLFNSPNIQSVVLNSEIRCKNNFYTKLIDICNAKRQAEGTSFPIKKFKINLKEEPTEDDLGVWRIMKLPLEHLCYAATPAVRGTTGISEVNVITANSADTLKILEVFQPPIIHSELLRTLSTELVNLEEIYCYGSVFSRLEFLNQMPKLKVLYLDYKCLNNLDKIYKLVETSHRFKHIQKQYFPQGRKDLLGARAPLEIIQEKIVRFHIDVDLGSWSWSLVSKWMPNLKILEAPLRENAFTKVCKHLPNLEELVLLYESYVTDSEITGVSSYVLRRNPHNLTSIKGLKKFVMKRSCGKYGASGLLIEGCLGDLSIYKGFLKMKKLEEVQFPASEEITEKAISALKRRVAKVEVIRYYEPGPHGNGECCKVTSFLDAAETKYADRDIFG